MNSPDGTVADKNHERYEESNHYGHLTSIPRNRRVFRKVSIPEQIETLRQNSRQKFGCTSSYKPPLFPRTKNKLSDDNLNEYHPWSCKRHCSLPYLSSHIAWNPTRIRNLMLAVGPGTPASALWRSRARCEQDNELDTSSMESDDELEATSGIALGTTDASMSAEGDDNDHAEDDIEECSGDDDNDEDDSANDSDNDDNSFTQAFERWIQEEEPLTDPQPQSDSEQPPFKNWLPSISHEGCINTACWLNVPWRLSSSSSANNAMSVSSNGRHNYVPKSNESSAYEIPTQLITSGDDCMINIWDVKNSMGTMSPLDGGWDTFTPLTLSSMKDIGSCDVYDSWVKYYDERNEESNIPGSVKLLVTMNSGHRANVFHVQPLAHKPGHILSCGADGFLRLSDLESSTSTEVVDPDMEDPTGSSSVNDSIGRFRERMAYSFQLLSQNTGLLCSDRGLHHFDMRLRSTQQNNRSLYQPRVSSSSSRISLRARSCKACAVWAPQRYRGYESYPEYAENEMETTYVFAGGYGEHVELLDLRMLGGSSSNIVLERYSSDVLKGGKSTVCVSSIDVTRDGRELLVSYENDQIYSFKIFGNTSCRAGPSLKEIEESVKYHESDSSRCIDYLAMYGGHVNCVTFLKQTAYAGPNDEYILTGGDAGKAWIYERSTGEVAALLNADRNACNGIVPHPTLPYFVTYGIDSTAKVWRARSTQDSPLARADASVKMTEYESSSLRRNWYEIRSDYFLSRYDETPLVFPDDMSALNKSDEDTDLCGREVAGTSFKTFCSIYGNSLRCLDSELSGTKSRNFQAKMSDSFGTLAQSLHVHSVGISWRRLQTQATRVGMRVNICAPWVFEKYISMKNPVCGFHPADLVPDHPSDWIPYHPLLQNVPFPDAYSNLIELHRAYPGYDSISFDSGSKKLSLCLPWLSDELQQKHMNTETSNWDSGAETPLSSFKSERLPAPDSSKEELRKNRVHSEHDIVTSTRSSVALTPLQTRSGHILEDTIVVLKNGGNEAMKLGLHYKAAQRYDKAISYCAVALMPHLESDKTLAPFTTAYLMGGNASDFPPGAPCKIWSPLSRNYLAIRLNLSLLMLKPEFNRPSYAADEALMVLHQLGPFTTKMGTVVFPDVVTHDKEPIETYIEAKAIQAKAYFRLGCARYELKDYAKAVKSFQSSLDCFHDLQSATATTNPDAPRRQPDTVLLRRLQDAKVQLKRKIERTNKKFQSALGSSPMKS